MMVRVVILEPYDGILMLKLSQLKCNLFTVQIFYLDLKRQTAKMANGKMTNGKRQKWQMAK